MFSAQIELEKARSSKLKSELMKAKAMEGQLVSLLEQSKVQGQCSYVEVCALETIKSRF